MKGKGFDMKVENNKLVATEDIDKVNEFAK